MEQTTANGERPFTKIDDEIMERADLSGDAKCLYARILRYQAGGIVPSQARLAEKLGRSRRKIQRLLDELKGRGLLGIADAGLGKRNKYEIGSEPAHMVGNFEPEAGNAEPVTCAHGGQVPAHMVRTPPAHMVGNLPAHMVGTIERYRETDIRDNLETDGTSYRPDRGEPLPGELGQREDNQPSTRSEPEQTALAVTSSVPSPRTGQTRDLVEPLDSLPGVPLESRKPKQARTDTRSASEQTADAAIVELKPTIAPVLGATSWTRWRKLNRPILVDMAVAGMSALGIVGAHARESAQMGEPCKSMSVLQQRLESPKNPWAKNNGVEPTSQQSKLSARLEEDLARSKAERQAARDAQPQIEAAQPKIAPAIVEPPKPAEVDNSAVAEAALTKMRERFAHRAVEHDPERPKRRPSSLRDRFERPPGKAPAPTRVAEAIASTTPVRLADGIAALASAR